MKIEFDFSRLAYSMYRLFKIMYEKDESVKNGIHEAKKFKEELLTILKLLKC